MIEKVKAAIERYKMLEEGERVLVALSGGADSTALLLALAELGYSVFAVHVNHNLRGGEALRDRRFCEELCKSKGIELYVESVDVRGYCEKTGKSIELGARELRYSALGARSRGAKIATAHTLSDSLETALLNFIRGSGTKGLAGIPAVRGNIIRPLIYCSRKEIEEYLSCKGQDFVTDSTNLEPDCSRNIIRLSVIPELKKINPNLEKSFINTSSALIEDDLYIESGAEKLLKNSSGKVYDFTDAEDNAALSRAILKLLKSENIEPSFEKITAVKEIIRLGGRINIKKGVYINSAGGKITFERELPKKREYPLDLDSGAEHGGKALIVTKISPFDISLFNKSELKFMVDEAKIAGNLVWRNYIGNEKIRLPGRGFSSVIKKLLCGLSPEQRRGAVVIADGEGAIFVENIGVSERVCCGSETVSAVKIEIKDAQEGDGK